MNKTLEALRVRSDSDAGRELLFLYEECLWRSTRLDILHELGRFAQPRVLEFLMRVAAEESDIPFAEAAVCALGRSGAPLASRFLAQFFETCSNTLKPSVVVALGRLGERSVVPALLALLPKALAEGQSLLARNTLLTLAELRATEAIAFLQDMALHAKDPDVVLSALMALGKVSRDPAWFDALEGRFVSDLYRYQVFEAARAQARLRSQWTLEDSLAKLFHSDDSEGNSALEVDLASELGTFASDDVLAGLEMFQERRCFVRCCVALRYGFHPQEAPKAFEQVVRAALLDESRGGALERHEVCALLQSLAGYRSAAFRSLLFELKPTQPTADSGLWALWLDTLVLCLPDALAECEGLLQRGEVPLPEPTLTEAPVESVGQCSVAFVNAVVNAALVSAVLPKKQKLALKILDKLLEHFPESQLKQGSAVAAECVNRLLRGYGQLRVATPKALSVAKALVSEPTHAASSLFFWERAGGASLLEAVSPLVDSLRVEDAQASNVFKALAASSTPFPESHGVFDKADAIFKECLSFQGSEAEQNTRTRLVASLLHFLGRFPCTRPQGKVAASLRSHILACLKCEEDSILLPAFLAAKALAAEEFSEAIAVHLRSGRAAVSGRALDALLFLRGNRPKRLVFEHLEKNALDLEVCEKVIRDLKPPQDANAHFVARLDAFLLSHPKHPLRDGFLHMRESLASGVSQRVQAALEKSGFAPSEMDDALKKRVDGFDGLNEEVKAALRAAEAPFLRPDVFNGLVDKSISILEYAKALDLVLEHELGRQALFPKLESNLAWFQNRVHAVGLAEDAPHGERVMRHLALERAFSPESFPLHKMTTLCRTVLTGRILFEHWKVFDGLRAWAVVLLLFCRPGAQTAQGAHGAQSSQSSVGREPPLVFFPGASDAALVDFAKRLIDIQEVRNPAAHRKTHLDFDAVEDVRTEVFALLALWRSFRERIGL